MKNVHFQPGFPHTLKSISYCLPKETDLYRYEYSKDMNVATDMSVANTK